MARRASEAIVLRTYPLREADLIVSFFTRDEGKLRGTARGARKPKNLFGAGLERLSLVRMDYSLRENRDLMTLVSCELLHSPFGVLSDYGASLALDYVAETSEQLLPPHEPNEKFFRLILAVLNHLAGDPQRHLWPAVTYFGYWAVRLTGVLSEMRLGVESREIADEMAVTPISQLQERSWTKATAADLRRHLTRQIEEHVERKLMTVPLLEAL